jgi:TolA-binding protein
MHGNKTGALTSFWKATPTKLTKISFKTPANLLFAGVFLCSLSGCVMTKAQGDILAKKIDYLENEMARLQRVRHDMEILLGQVRSIVDRIGHVEGQLLSVKESLSEDSFRNTDLRTELQNLRNELEEAQNRYRNLEQEQQNLARQKHTEVKKIEAPASKDDHFQLAKKLVADGKIDESIQLFEQFTRDYPNDREFLPKAYYFLGENYRSLAETNPSKNDADKYFKKSIVSYQKVTESKNDLTLREEALFKMGMVLKAMNNADGALAAFKELLTTHAKGKRVAEVKKQVAELEKPKNRPKSK